jgi:hypothetical protein
LVAAALNPRKIPRQAFGMPFVMHLSTKRTTARQLYTMVWHRLSRFMKRDITRPYGSTSNATHNASRCARACRC